MQLRNLLQRSESNYGYNTTQAMTFDINGGSESAPWQRSAASESLTRRQSSASTSAQGAQDKYRQLKRMRF